MLRAANFCLVRCFVGYFDIRNDIQIILDLVHYLGPKSILIVKILLKVVVGLDAPTRQRVGE